MSVEGKTAAGLVRLVCLRILVLTWLVFSGGVQALSLGEIQANSRVGERLNATIPVESRKSFAADQMLVSIAPRSVYDRMGVYWEYFHADLNFSVERLGSKRALISVSSDGIINEPYINFVISVRWPEGLITREYTLLLDMVAVERGGGISAPIVSQNVEVVESRPEPSRSAPSASETISRNNFSQPNTTSNFDAETLQDNVSSFAADQSWEVQTQYGDTLWAIAKRIELESGVGVRKVMQALYENNPQAFGSSVNDLRANSTMAVTMSQMQAARNVVLPKQQKKPGLDREAQRAADREKQSLSAAEDAERDAQSEASETESQGSDNAIAESSGVLSVVAEPEIGASELVTEPIESGPQSNEQNSEQSDDLGSTAELALDEANGRVEQELREATEKAEAIEARLTALLQQYEVLSEKTEKLKELESELNRRIASKAAAGIDAPVTKTELEAASAAASSRSNQSLMERYRWPLVIVALLLLAGLVAIALTRVQRMVPVAEESPVQIVDDWDDTAFLEQEKLDDDQLAEIVKLKGEQAFVENQKHSESVPVGGSNVDETDNSVELQAAMFIAYERYDEAEEIINESLLQNPDNTPLKLQLLEIFAAREDRLQFGLLANRLRELNDPQINATIDALSQF